VLGVLVVWIVATAAIAAKLVVVQVVDADGYRERAIAQTHREVVLPAERGMLTDRDLSPLAISLAAATVYVDPPDLRESGVDRDAAAERLAKVLHLDADDVLTTLASDAPFAYVARQVPREAGEAVEDLQIPGVGVIAEPVREYPAGNLAAPVLGLAGVDHVGLSGLEHQHDEALAGQPGRLFLERAPGGVEITAADRVVEPSVPGTDLVLTLDRGIQAETEDALRDVVSEQRADGAAAVVMDPHTGEVLAMASIGADGGPGRNLAVTDAYEPGSVDKVITVSAALEEGVVDVGDSLHVPASVEVGGAVFREAHGGDEVLSLPEVMARSSNVGTIRLAQRLGEERLQSWVERFGYGRTTGLGFPGEAAGLVADTDDWSSTSLPTIAIGYGVSATLLQIADVFATVANGGELVAPSLIRGQLVDGELQPAAPAARQRVLSERTAGAMARMLSGVVGSEEGTGGLAAVPGYPVAGKTGTARKPSTTSRGYEEGAYVASFAGFAPADDPALVVAVSVDHPREEIFGGTVAAPVFSRIAAFALASLRVPPTTAPPPADPTPTSSPAREALPR